MLVEFYTLAIAYVVVRGAVDAVKWAIEKRNLSRLRQESSQFLVKPVLTEKDEEIIRKINTILKDRFPEGIEARFRNLDIHQRQELIKDIIDELQSIYGIELANIAFKNSEEVGYGTYCFFWDPSNNLVISIDYLAANEPIILQRLLETIIQECRKAYQLKAIRSRNLEIASPQQRELWALNWRNYISSETDFVLFTQQIVEADARLIAERSMIGVKK